MRSLIDPVSCVSCVTWMYSVNAAETYETFHLESGMRYHSTTRCCGDDVAARIGRRRLCQHTRARREPSVVRTLSLPCQEVTPGRRLSACRVVGSWEPCPRLTRSRYAVDRVPTDSVALAEVRRRTATGNWPGMRRCAVGLTPSDGRRSREVVSGARSRVCLHETLQGLGAGQHVTPHGYCHKRLREAE